ncbi:Hypothetical predicted protein, partial [Marmota monax]
VDIQIISRFTVTHEDMSVHRQGLLSTQGNVYAMYGQRELVSLLLSAQAGSLGSSGLRPVAERLRYPVDQVASGSPTGAERWLLQCPSLYLTLRPTVGWCF